MREIIQESQFNQEEFTVMELKAENFQIPKGYSRRIRKEQVQKRTENSSTVFPFLFV